MRRQSWVAAVLACLGVLHFSLQPASAQDVRTGVEELASQIAKAAPEGKQLRVAVADFPDLQGVTSDLGRYIASRLTTRLAQNPKFFVIERQRLGQVLAELKFSMSDLVDPTKAKELGRMAGVEAIVVGTVSDLGNQVDLDARLIEIETNRMLLGATATISRDQVVDDMLKRGRQESAATPLPPGTGPTTPVAPSQDRKLRYAHTLFVLELDTIEAAGGSVKLTFLYTNLTSARQEVKFGPVFTPLPYLVDSRGNRHEFAGTSLQSHGVFGYQRTFEPKLPERLWISFQRVEGEAEAASLLARWYITDDRGRGVVHDIRIRDIPLRR